MRPSLPPIVLIAALATACGGGEEPVGPPTDLATATATGSTTVAPTPTATDAAGEPFAIDIEGGSPVGGIQTIAVELGADVEIVVTADAAHEVHLHGYDLYADVTPDQDGRLAFTADIPGTFEIELEGEHRKIAELQVTP